MRMHHRLRVPQAVMPLDKELPQTSLTSDPCGFLESSQYWVRYGPTCAYKMRILLWYCPSSGGAGLVPLLMNSRVVALSYSSVNATKYVVIVESSHFLVIWISLYDPCGLNVLFLDWMPRLGIEIKHLRPRPLKLLRGHGDIMDFEISNIHNLFNRLWMIETSKLQCFVFLYNKGLIRQNKTLKFWSCNLSRFALDWRIFCQPLAQISIHMSTNNTASLDTFLLLQLLKSRCVPLPVAWVLQPSLLLWQHQRWLSSASKNLQTLNNWYTQTYKEPSATHISAPWSNFFKKAYRMLYRSFKCLAQNLWRHHNVVFGDFKKPIVFKIYCEWTWTNRQYKIIHDFFNLCLTV